jgi:hypothetical protein
LVTQQIRVGCAKNFDSAHSFFSRLYESDVYGRQFYSRLVGLAVNRKKAEKTPGRTAELQRVGSDFAQKHEAPK